jgi:hypothetical protein
MIFSRCAFAGFLTGDMSPNIRSAGQHAVKIGTSIIMVETPFSSAQFSYKFGLSDEFNISGKIGTGKIDYATVSGTKTTYDPQIWAVGLEYNLFMSEDKSGKSALIVEYENVTWQINKLDNLSTDFMFGYDIVGYASDNTLTRTRIGIHNFNAGQESNEKISTSTKYSLSTEIEYRIISNLTVGLEGGLFFGDMNGILAYFGLNFGFNT